MVGLAVAGGGGGRGMTSALYCSSSKLLYSGMTSSLSLLSRLDALFSNPQRERMWRGGRAGKVVVCGVIMRWCCGDRVCAAVGATKISESIISFSILCLVIIMCVCVCLFTYTVYVYVCAIVLAPNLLAHQ